MQALPQALVAATASARTVAVTGIVMLRAWPVAGSVTSTSMSAVKRSASVTSASPSGLISIWICSPASPPLEPTQSEMASHDGRPVVSWPAQANVTFTTRHANGASAGIAPSMGIEMLSAFTSEPVPLFRRATLTPRVHSQCKHVPRGASI